MRHYDWDKVDQLACEIASLEEAVRNSAGVSEAELQEAYHRLQALLRDPVREMTSALVRDSTEAERITNNFLDRVPLILPVRASMKIPCSRWIAGAVIDFVYHATDAARNALSDHEARLLSTLADAQPRAPLDTEALELIDRVRSLLSIDEFLIWYDYVINSYDSADIAHLHHQTREWVEHTLQRARQKLWDAATTDKARRTRTDVFGQSLTWLGTLPLHDHSSVAYSVACNGAVAGVAFAEEYRYSDTRGDYTAYIACAFRWENHQFTELGELGENCRPCCMITPDGAKVMVSSDTHCLLWDATRGMQRFEGSGSVYAMNAYGNILVGEADGHAVCWVDERRELLPGEAPSAALAVSPDGRFIVGRIREQAVCWDMKTGVVRRLGTLGGEYSEARAVSQDGTVIVGKSDGRAFRWTAEEGVCALSQRDDEISQAHSVSYDGRRIVGEALDEESSVYAFLWTEEDGLQNLNVLFAHLREMGATLERAYAISPDGRYIVGEGYCTETERKEAFLIDLGKFAC